MLEQFRKLFSILKADERRAFLVLVATMVLVAFAEILGLSVFMVLLAILAQPEQIAENEWLSRAYEWLNPSSLLNFQLTLSLAAAAAILGGLALKALSTHMTNTFAAYTGHNLSSRMLRAYLNQPYSWSLGRNATDTGRTILGECETLVQSVAKPALEILASCLLAISIMGFLLTVDPVIALVSFVILAGGYSSVYLLAREKLKSYGAIILEARKKRFRVTMEATNGLKDVKLAGLEDVYTAEFDAPSLRRVRHLIKSQILTVFPRFVLEGLTFLLLLAIVLVLMVRNDGDLLAAIPTLGIFAFSVMRILPALQKVYYGFATLRTGIAIIDDIYADYMLLAVDKRKPDPIDRTSRLELREKLQFNTISFSYPNAEKTALSELSTQIEAHSVIGIVGSTGAGKTTFVDILLGLLSPDTGEILVDGTEITGENLRAWQNSIGYVPQQIFLTDDTVASNIAFGVPVDDVDMAAVERAAKTAALHDFILKELPEGYETPIGDRGVRLSGGQRQRVGIARALYHNPSLLILDEATSALDNITERAVISAVRELQHDKTIIMIAHRLSTIEDCDKILLFDSGRIATTGTFGELAANNVLFQEMLGEKATEAEKNKAYRKISVVK